MVTLKVTVIMMHVLVVCVFVNSHICDVGGYGSLCNIYIGQNAGTISSLGFNKSMLHNDWIQKKCNAGLVVCACADVHVHTFRLAYRKGHSQHLKLYISLWMVI